MKLSDIPADLEELNVFELITVLKHGGGEGVKFAFARGLLQLRKPCPHCGSPDRVALHRNSGSPDDFAFNCGQCKKRFSVRYGTFFWRSRLPIADIITIIICFVSDTPVTQAASWTRMSLQTIVDWYSLCRRVCAHALNTGNMLLGGPGIKVEIDDSIMLKRKPHQDSDPGEYRFFGGYCVVQKRGFLVPIETRDTLTLTSLISKHIAPGSIIHGVRSIECLDLPYDEIPYYHDNISESTRRPEKNLGSPGVACFWGTVLRKLRFAQGSQGSHTIQRVIEAVYKHNFGFGYRMSFSERLALFVDHINDFCCANTND